MCLKLKLASKFSAFAVSHVFPFLLKSYPVKHPTPYTTAINVTSDLHTAKFNGKFTVFTSPDQPRGIWQFNSFLLIETFSSLSLQSTAFPWSPSHLTGWPYLNGPPHTQTPPVSLTGNCPWTQHKFFYQTFSLWNAKELIALNRISTPGIAKYISPADNVKKHG